MGHPLISSAAPIEIWGGLECSVVRLGDDYRDLVRETGHFDRAGDLDQAAGLGIRVLRYPVLWEQVVPDALDTPEWRWHDARLARLRALGVEPIVGLVHHGSGPRYTDLLDPAFPELLARYAGMVARRYPWVDAYTPVNEPGTTARFSCLYGHWYPHKADTPSFLRALFHQCRGTALAMAAIREVTPRARLIQTEDIGRTYSTPALRYQADYQDERRWLAFDLLCGRVDHAHPWRRAFEEAGIDARELDALVFAPCPPDIVGINHYLTSDRFLDQRLGRYPEASRGSNGVASYADVEAVRVARKDLACAPADRLREAWQRYGLPVALTEVHNGCTREEQLRWLHYARAGLLELKNQGVDVRAITLWAMFGTLDWDSLLKRRAGNYEPGLFDIRSTPPRPTILARAASAWAAGGQFDDHSLDSPGWWTRDDRYFRPARSVVGAGRATQRQLLITGATGTLAQAFAAACRGRGLPYVLTHPEELDTGDHASIGRALATHRPWAVINAADHGRVERAEAEPSLCHREDAQAAEALAIACGGAHAGFVTFSSDLAFDGLAGRPHVESDRAVPSSAYGHGKGEAERRVLAAWPKSMIVRTRGCAGSADRHSFFDGVLLALRNGEPLAASTASRVSPTYGPDLVNAVLDLLIDGAEGVWHLANVGEVA